MTKKKNKKADMKSEEADPALGYSSEAYPCYVRIGETVGSEEMVELPTEKDGTMLLSTVTAQYADAIGLRFKSESGAWRGVRVNDDILNPPLEGWGNGEYYIVIAKKAGKRKLDDSESTGVKRKMTEKEMLTDLIVLGLPYASTEDDLKSYFEKYGELAHHEIKFEPQTNKSRGFGFIRYTTIEAVETVLAESHSIGGRKCEVRFPKKSSQDDTPTKLFIGRLPQGTTVEDLKDSFSEYEPLKDVYIPTNFRGFGFVTFSSQADAREVLNSTHVIKGSYVNISHPAPKAGEQNPQNMQMQQQQQQQPQYEYGYGNMQGNMHMQQMQPQVGGYGSQQNTTTNSGYYTSGYYQPGGKLK